MGSLMNLLRGLSASRGARWIGVPLLGAAALLALVTQSQTTTIPTVSLATEPLYARGARAKPTLTLALSVEFPTVGAQYVSAPRATSDDTYSTSGDPYIGYFDSESCYLYNNGATAAERYFYRTGEATNRECNGTGFSGNFMNWATSSAIDILRYGLTGGDRVVDTASLTVLQRAVLPNTGVSNNFWNGSNFPSKVLRAAKVGGAVPSSMLGTHTGDVFVANCLNRVHFGTQATGSCASPGNNSNLGTPQSGTVPNNGMYSGTLPSDFTQFATESYPAAGPTYTVTGTQQIVFGSGSTWAVLTQTGGTVQCSNVAWATYGVAGLGSSGDPTPGTAKTCRWRTPPAGTTGLTADNYFFARVRVCESDASGALLDPRTSLCLRYPNGNYKPVGNLQKYSDRVRVAAFGYLNDSPSDPQRYGGVLRAPMKYVGPKYYDANFTLLSSTNPNREWNEYTGELRANPEGQTTINSGADSSNPNGRLSGVINYLNQFGRTGTFGQYKTYDAVGELYYEAVRYIQGLQPTDVSSTVGGSAIWNSAGKEDGFPVYTTWTDPHPAVTGMTDYSCVKNNIVGIGDVNTHNDRSIPGNTRTGRGDFERTANAAANEPNFVEWTKVVGAFESNVSYTYQGTTGANISINAPYIPSLASMATQNIGADNASYYMAGIAYWAHTHDIRGTGWTSPDTDKQRPGMRLTTYWLDVNEYGEQSVKANRIKNQFYLAAKYGGFNDVTKTGNPYKTNGASGLIDSNENWTNAAGEAKNYFLSSSASAVLAALDQIFAQIAAEANSIAGGAISTQRLTTSGGQVYQAQFDAADWSGDLIAYPVSVSGSAVSIGVPVDSPWKNAANVSVGAAGKLDDISDIDSRKIYVGYNDGSGVFGSTAFKWNSMNTVTQNLLRLPAYVASAPYDPAASGAARVEYLRGNRALEAGGTFRRRGSRLGDIVNSGVAFSGTPPVLSSDSAYKTFYDDHKTRDKALFVGANDGMLHAFNADTGSELFAYIPSWVVPRLTELTSPNYVHAPFVDASPTVAEAKVGTEWKTVLVSGTGAGGQGVFALDVSNPASFDDSKVLWEFTDHHDVEMGNVVGHPKILKINTTAGTATATYKYFAVFASGVNNYAPDGRALPSTDPNYGSQVLFFLDLSKPKASAWALGENYYKVRFPAPITTMQAGMIDFAVRFGNAGQLTYLYAGDLQGNLWKLDFTKTAPADWTIDALSYFKNGTAAMPMFIAKDGATTPNRQPISMEPALVFGANRGIIVSFGTGKYLETSDTSGPYKAQSVYALLDNNSPDADAASPSAAISSRNRLAQGSLDGSTIDVPAFVWGRATADTGSVKSGWVFDFPNSDTVTGPTGRAGTGERQISAFGVLAGRLIFGSVIPAVNSCDSGSGNLYMVNVKTGDGSSQASTVGILGEPFLVQVGDSTLTKSDTTGRRKETTRYQIILQGSSGVASPPSLGQTVTGYPGRLSWREISNYQELRNAP